MMYEVELAGNFTFAVMVNVEDDLDEEAAEELAYDLAINRFWQENSDLLCVHITDYDIREAK